MRSAKMQTFLLSVLFLLVVTAIASSLYFYKKEYQERIKYFTKQTKKINLKLSSIKTDLSNFQSNFEELDIQLKKYSDNLEKLEVKLKDGNRSRQTIFVQMDQVKRDIQSWRQRYTSTLDELKKKVELLNQTVQVAPTVEGEQSKQPQGKRVPQAQAEQSSQRIELGDIFVEKKESLAPQN